MKWVSEHSFASFSIARCCLSAILPLPLVRSLTFAASLIFSPSLSRIAWVSLLTPSPTVAVGVTKVRAAPNISDLSNSFFDAGQRPGMKSGVGSTQTKNFGHYIHFAGNVLLWGKSVIRIENIFLKSKCFQRRFSSQDADLNRAIWGSEPKPLLPLTAERVSGSKIGLLTRAPVSVPGHDQIADFVGWMSL